MADLLSSPLPPARHGQPPPFETQPPSWSCRALIPIVAAGAVVRLLLWAWFQDAPIHIWDELDYNRIATNLVQRGEFALRAGSPTSARPPLYPVALAGLYGLFGPESFPAVRERNFMMGNYRHTPLYRAWDAVSLTGEQHWYHELAATYPPTERVTRGQIDELAFRQGLAFVLDNPALTAQRDVVKFFHFWGLERELIAGAAFGYFGPIGRPALVVMTLVIFGSYTAALLSAIFGALLAPPADRRAQGLVLLVIGFICAVHTLTFGHSRYHPPSCRWCCCTRPPPWSGPARSGGAGASARSDWPPG